MNSYTELIRIRTFLRNVQAVDDGFEEGMEIPIYYDPMIAKLIAHAPTRNEAIEKLTKAINNSFSSMEKKSFS